MLDFSDYYNPKASVGGKSYKAYLKRRAKILAKKKKEAQDIELDNSAISQGEI
tara:strand:- start:4324 stop:4482 length:159 start_codon:yes stop_codon:yes gene_type:complete